MDLEADIKVIHCMLCAMINTHPNRAELRRVFESIVAQIQVSQATNATVHTNTRQDFPKAVRRYLDHFDLQDSRDK